MIRDPNLFNLPPIDDGQPPPSDGDLSPPPIDDQPLGDDLPLPPPYHPHQ